MHYRLHLLGYLLPVSYSLPPTLHYWLPTLHRLAMEVHSFSYIEVIGYGLTGLVLVLTSLLYSTCPTPAMIPPTGSWTDYNGVMGKAWAQGELRTTHHAPRTMHHTPHIMDRQTVYK